MDCKNCGEPIEPCSPWGWHHKDGPAECTDWRDRGDEPQYAEPPETKTSDTQKGE